ncbi:MAG: hypothetical protein ACI35S_00805 [Anaeroplasma sp.]
MKNRLKTIIVFIIIICLVIVIEILNSIDIKNSSNCDYSPKNGGKIHLYGEYHGEIDFYNKELEIWGLYYEKGNRDLFVELPYYTAEFLNLWMKENDDEILNQIYTDIDGTASHTEDYLFFLRTIKMNYTETIFHGTDVGHQYMTTGARYLDYLESLGMEDSEKYELASNCIAQGEHFYGMDATDPYREQMMVENFIAQYERIGQKEVMGIYGSYHINPNDSELMAGQIKEKYGDIVEGIYISNMLYLVKKPSFSFGFGYVGIIFLLMLFIPNFIWTKNQPIGYEEYVKKENRILRIMEKFGEVGATILLLIFTDFNFKSGNIGNRGFYFSYLDLYIVLAFVLMILYEVYWIRYFKSEHTMKDFYSEIAGIPLAGATLPVLSLLLIGISARNVALIPVALVLGIGHIGIHYMHYIEINNEE